MSIDRKNRVFRITIFYSKRPDFGNQKWIVINKYFYDDYKDYAKNLQACKKKLQRKKGIFDYRLLAEEFEDGFWKEIEAG